MSQLTILSNVTNSSSLIYFCKFGNTSNSCILCLSLLIITESEIRLFKKEDDVNNWQSVPVVSHMPNFLTSEGAHDNLKKRILNIYRNYDRDVIKIRWNFVGNDDGFWIEL